MHSIAIIAIVLALFSASVIGQDVATANAFADSLPGCFKPCTSSSYGVNFPLSTADVKTLCVKAQSNPFPMLVCLNSRCPNDVAPILARASELQKFCSDSSSPRVVDGPLRGNQEGAVQLEEANALAAVPVTVAVLEKAAVQANGGSRVEGRGAGAALAAIFFAAVAAL
ncbi:hypothetical protein HDU96_005109 [Phlyctochytrium bullatum]|nr:hypothetical protein HDU96_005109 [Phlyctochytrium bullatum]